MKIKNQQLNNILILNIAMLFISTSGVLGRSIRIAPPLTVFWRALLALLLVAVICWWQGLSLRKIQKQDFKVIIICGVLMSFHWIFYFYALQLSTVAIGMLSVFTYPVFTAIIEPIILKTRFQYLHLILALMTFIGITFLIPDFNFESNYLIAIIFGVISAISYSLRNVLMKNQVQKYNGLLLMYTQVLIISIILIPMLFFYSSQGLEKDIPAIFLLALLTTVIGHTLFLMTFRNFSITTASIMSCVQPIYGIILGVIFLGEYPPFNTYIGGAFILGAVIVESFRSKTTNET